MWEEITLNTCVQRSEQSFWGETGCTDTTAALQEGTGRRQADIQVPTVAAVKRGQSEKQYLLLYLRPSQLKYGFFFPHLD